MKNLAVLLFYRKLNRLLSWLRTEFFEQSLEERLMQDIVRGKIRSKIGTKRKKRFFFRPFDKQTDKTVIWAKTLPENKILFV